MDSLIVSSTYIISQCIAVRIQNNKSVAIVEYRICGKGKSIRFSDATTFRFVRCSDNSFQIIMYILPVLCGEISGSFNPIIRSQNFLQAVIELEYHFGAFGLMTTEH